MIIVSKKLRDSARLQECTLRLPGICNFNIETTTLAHAPCNSKGVGMKGADNISVFACSACAWVTDNKPFTIPAKDWLRAIQETQTFWIKNELVMIKGMQWRE